MIRFGREVCQDWEQATSREWLETNGLGGYASSTIAGVNTRRYHGLLIAPLRPPTQRTLLLSKLEDTLVVGDADYDLSCNQYPGVVYPQGHRHLLEFRLDPFPTFLYEVTGPPTVRLEKTVGMRQGLNAVFVRYRLLEAESAIGLVIRPVINCRDHHHLMRENATFNTHVEMSSARDRVRLQPYPGVPPLQLLFEGACFEPYGYWYRDFQYTREAERGLDYSEDQYSPGYFSCRLAAGESTYLVATVGDSGELDPGSALAAEAERRSRFVAPWANAPEGVRQLVLASDVFGVRASHSSAADRPEAVPRGIIAGYHWFEEWGRDAMISLPGLMLVTRQFDSAKQILRTYAGHCRGGLIPNRLPETGAEPDYNTADATLWMFWAAHKYTDYTGNEEFVREELLPVFLDVIEWHTRGTRFGIGVDDDGLLRAGASGSQLTWMDAKIGDWVVTPRHGKPVEVNALWHHALRFVEELGARHAGPPADGVAEAFRARFWNEQAGYLNDLVDEEAREDCSLRPNQVIALSLPYPVVGEQQARRALTAVEKELLTPYGLRTLSPRDPRYRGLYRGNQWSRDSAYHQGTVWPWLLGPFITAYVRHAAKKDKARRTARGWLEPIWAHLHEAGLGFVSEVFDGDQPHQPGGCVAQAWSVAEILRAAVEDVKLGVRPA